MRFYLVKIRWQNHGSGYDRTDAVGVTATSVRAAVARALRPALRSIRKGWREPENATFDINIKVCHRVEKEDQ